MAPKFLLVLLIACSIFGCQQVAGAPAPPPNSPGYCDSLNTAVSGYVAAYSSSSYSLGNFNAWISTIFGTGYYDSLGNFVPYTLAYWQTQFVACGIPCPPLANCDGVQGWLSYFISRNPEFADSCPPFLWANSLDQNYPFGYTTEEWMQVLTCCGMSYPAPVATPTYCDTLAALVSEYNSTYQNNPSLSQFESLLAQVYGWGYTDSIGIYHSYNLTYWKNKLNACGIACPAFIYCSNGQNLMSSFINNNPAYADSCPPVVLADYFNYFSGGDYDGNDWEQILTCCGIVVPAADSLATNCDTVNALANYYISNFVNQYSPQAFTNTFSQVFGSGYFDSTGAYINYDLAYWVNKLNACGVACPPLVNCSQVQYLMSTFLNSNPQYTDSCPAVIWVYFLNQRYAGGYSIADWKQILTCCGIYSPTPVPLRNYCDSLRAIVSTYEVTYQNNYSLSEFEYTLSQFYGYGYYNDSTDSYVSYDLTYWMGKFNMCGIACPTLVNCSQVQSLMNNFVSQNPQYADSCPMFLWAGYLSHSSGYNFSTGDWQQILTCCGITYPAPDTLHTNCDSLNAFVTLYISSYQANYSVGNFENIFASVYGWGYMDSIGQFNYYSLAYWISKLSACGIGCPPLANCSQVQSLMSNFITTYPQFASTCPAFLWANYLNQNYGYGYSTGDWQQILTCCGITFPTPDTLANHCDTLNALVNVYNDANQGSPNLWNFENILSQIYGSGYTDSNGNYIDYDLAHWVNMLMACGIPCPQLVQCASVQTYMSSFTRQYPQYANNCPPVIWVDYLNQNYGGGYAVSDWEQILACCGINFPTPDTLRTYCDSLGALVSIYIITNANSYNLGAFENTLAQFYGYGYYDSLGNYNNYNLAYWEAKLNLCGIACPPLANCGQVATLMANFTTQNPQYAASCPAVIWSDYLSQNAGYGYTTSDWELILTCCGISFPTPDSLNTYCDSLSAMVAVYTISNYPNNYNLYNFENTLAQFYGYGYYDSLGRYYNYNLAYWKTKLEICGIACPPLANCGQLATLMANFTTQNPQYADSCPAFIWGYYLSQNAGYGYTTADWEQILQCCGVSYPTPDSLYNYCDSLSALVSLYVIIDSNNYSIQQFENTMGQFFATNYYVDSIGTYVNYNLTYWKGKLGMCGIACPPLANCGALQALMDTFITDNPQYALGCPPFLWVNYINNNTGYGYSTGDWMQVLQCCGIAYPTPETAATYCDSLSAVVSVYSNIYRNEPDLMTFENMLIPVFGSGYTDSDGTYVNYDLTYWKGQLTICGLGCPPLVKCDTVQTLMNNFIGTYPQYQNGCPPFVWVYYLNQYNKWGYNINDWEQLMACCAISFPAPDTFATYCDTLSALVSIYNIAYKNNYNLNILEGILSNFYGWGTTDSNGYTNYTYTYWVGQFSHCGIACPPIVSCANVQSNLNAFFAVNPQYADSCPVSVWTSYLNMIATDSFGYVDWIEPADWVTVLNCCGISFPRPDTPVSFCDTLAEVLAAFNGTDLQNQNTSLWNFENYMQNNLYAGYTNSAGNYVTADYNYWLAQIKNCNLPCPLIVNCWFADSLLNAFIAKNGAGFNGEIPDFIWANYLNNNNAGNGNWYSAANWRSILQCCGLPPAISTPDSAVSLCDSVSAVLDYFNFLAQQSPNQYNNADAFQNVFGQYISQGYRLPDGEWVNYGYNYWASELDSCHLTVPRFVSCSVFDSLMAGFLATAPVQYRHACPAIIWATYFNQAYFGQGNGGYSPDDWIGLAAGCNVSFPLDSGLPSKCDSISAIISVTNLSGEMPIMAVVNSFNAVARILNQNNNNNNGNQYIPLSYWMSVLDSCGYNCDRFLNCNGLDSALQQLYVNFPQYRDSCPGPLLSEYLDQKLGSNLFNGYAFSYNDWQQVASCCNLTLPATDQTFRYCDSMFYLYTRVQQAGQISDQCFPAWFYNNTALPQLGYNAIGQLCPALALCGLPCADTCTTVDITFCDSIRSVYRVYQMVRPYFSSLTVNDNLMEAASKAYLGYQLSYSRVVAYLDSCGPVTQCPLIASFTISDTVICNSDSTCFKVTGGAACFGYADSAGGRLMFSGATPFNLCGLVNPAISSGYHNVIAIIYSADSACTDTISRLIYIKPYCACGVTVDTCPELVANFGYTIYPGYVILKDKSIGNPTIIEWYVNGQNFVTGPGDTLKYVFAHSGLFEVCQTIHYLIYGSDQCCLKDTCMYIMGSVDTCLLLNLTADFTYTQNNNAPYTYTFSPIWPVNEIPSVVTWNFGDSSSVYSDTAIQAIHSFDTAGYYDVCVNEIWFLPGNYCCIDSQCYQVYVGGILPEVRVNPNPFQRTINVEFQVNHAGKVELLVFDALGRVTKTLINSAYYASGYYTMEFDLSDMTDALYNYRFRSADGIFTGKMIKQ